MGQATHFMGTDKNMGTAMLFHCRSSKGYGHDNKKLFPVLAFMYIVSIFPCVLCNLLYHQHSLKQIVLTSEIIMKLLGEQLLI